MQYTDNVNDQRRELEEELRRRIEEQRMKELEESMKRLSV